MLNLQPEKHNSNGSLNLIIRIPAESLEGEESADDGEGEDEGAVGGRHLAGHPGLLAGHQGHLAGHPGLLHPRPVWLELNYFLFHCHWLRHGHVTNATTWFENLCWFLIQLPPLPHCLPMPPPSSLSPFTANSLSARVFHLWFYVIERFSVTSVIEGSPLVLCDRKVHRWFYVISVTSGSML